MIQMKRMTEKLGNVEKWLKATLIAMGIVVFVRYFLLIPINVAGDSMSPQLEPNSYIVYGPYAKIERFDIILFHDNQGESYIKRIIGLPGETLAYRDDQLYINGEALEEPHLAENRNSNQLLTPDFELESLTGEKEIPEDSYFVMGDNRSRSKDSRMFGFVPQGAINGKARMVIYPFDAFVVLP